MGRPWVAYEDPLIKVMLSDGSDVFVKQGKQMKQLMLLLSLKVEEEELGVTQIT